MFTGEGRDGDVAYRRLPPWGSAVCETCYGFLLDSRQQEEEEDKLGVRESLVCCSLELYHPKVKCPSRLVALPACNAVIAKPREGNATVCLFVHMLPSPLDLFTTSET